MFYSVRSVGTKKAKHAIFSNLQKNILKLIQFKKEVSWNLQMASKANSNI
jgi:hypothetical protein